MKSHYPAFLATVILSFFSTERLNADTCLKLGADTDSSRTIVQYTPPVQKAFSVAGFCTEIINMHHKRIQSEIIQGKLDGEFFRVKSYVEGMSDHVVAIPTPVTTIYGTIVTLASSPFKPDSLEDIKSHAIGTLHGYNWHEVLSQKIKYVDKTDKYATLVKMLKAGRIDGFLADNYHIANMISNKIVSADEIRVSAPIIDLSVYILLHKKHIGLIGKLDTAVKQVVSEGGFVLK